MPSHKAVIAKFVGQDFLLDKVVKRAKAVFLWSYVDGLIRWPKSIGHPDIADFGKAFRISFARSQIIDRDGPGPQDPQALYFPYSTIHGVMGAESARYFQVSFREFIDDTPKGPLDPRFYVDPDLYRHRIIIELAENVRWLALDGTPSARGAVINPPRLFFHKKGRTVLPPFEVRLA
ncbi:hypothetical protein FHR70_003858 [Microvirga lupini]|uniref:Uncharacterized protein n=1 Tax=Microvirga lupini TaxID=420324 RepID=A0A7W4VP48_9HYPH|nr:hypothetical protein [Microvirga lupini]MBB3020770.1 hypothetical protein [Microvirga lupini]